MASVRLVNVTKRFGKTDALKNMTLEVNDKEFFVISGPPGVGKTTFLRIIAGLESPDEGEVYIGDEGWPLRGQWSGGPAYIYLINP